MSDGWVWGLDRIVIWSPWDNDLGARNMFRMWPQRHTEGRRRAQKVRGADKGLASSLSRDPVFQLPRCRTAPEVSRAKACRWCSQTTCQDLGWARGPLPLKVWGFHWKVSKAGMPPQLGLESPGGFFSGVWWWMLAVRWHFGWGPAEHLHVVSSHGLDFLPAPQSRGSQAPYKVEQGPRTNVPENKAKQPQLF